MKRLLDVSESGTRRDRQIDKLVGDVISTPLYAVAPSGESRYNLINPNLRGIMNWRG